MNQELLLLRYGSEVANEIKVWIEEHDGVFFRGTFSNRDKVMLFQFRIWSFKYMLPVREILDMVIPAKRRTGLKNYSKIKGTLGVPVTSLVNSGTERFLVEEIEQKYPLGEHIKLWRYNLQRAEMDAERGEEYLSTSKPLRLLDSNTVEDYLTKYRKRVLAARKENKAETDRRRRKPYRYNPWR